METKAKRHSSVLRIAVPALVALCLAGAANQLHIHRLQKGLQVLADEKLAEFQAESPPELGGTARMGAKVVVAKPYVFWGTPAGKVSVFIERPAEDGDAHIEGFEYFFARNGAGEWTQTESGHCTSDSCTIEGKKVLDVLGKRF